MEGELQDRRFAPPQAHVEDVEPPAVGLRLATRGSRLGAVIIDVVIALFVLWVVARLTPFDPWADAGVGLWSLHLATPLMGLAVFVVVHGWLIVKRGQTVGKALLKIRIARPDGSLPSPVRIVGLRYGVGWLTAVVPAAGQIWGIADAVLIFRADHRCLHDHIADTIVVKV